MIILPLNVAVAVVPSSSGIDVELQYIKSALLYADNVVLISPLAYLYTQLTYQPKEINEKHFILLFEKVIPFAKSQDPMLYEQGMCVLKQLKEIFNKKKYVQLPYAQRLNIIREAKELTKEVTKSMFSLIGVEQCHELETLISNNQVVIHKFNNSIADIDNIVKEYFEVLQNSLKNTSPLFDKQCYDLMNAAIKARVIKLSDMEKSKITHIGLVDNCLQRLPSFEEASIDELIDIKKELSKPLIRFRSKMLTFSNDIKSLPWDKDFVGECDSLFIKDIEPALLEIEEATHENSFRSNLGSKFLTEEGFWKSYNGLALGIATTGIITCLNEFTMNNYAILSGLGAAATAKFIEAIYEHQKEKAIIENNELYFYYKAEKILQSRK